MFAGVCVCVRECESVCLCKNMIAHRKRMKHENESKRKNCVGNRRYSKLMCRCVFVFVGTCACVHVCLEDRTGGKIGIGIEI